MKYLFILCMFLFFTFTTQGNVSTAQNITQKEYTAASLTQTTSCTFCNIKVTIDWLQCNCISNMMQSSIALLSCLQVIKKENAHFILKSYGAFDICSHWMRFFRALYYKKYWRATPHILPSNPGTYLLLEGLTDNKLMHHIAYECSYSSSICGLQYATKTKNRRDIVYYTQELLSALSYTLYKIHYEGSIYADHAWTEVASQIAIFVAKPLASLYVFCTHPTKIWPITLERVPLEPS